MEMSFGVYLYESFSGAVMWLFEGIKKAFGLFGPPIVWFGNKVALPFSWLQDATAGAPQAVEQRGC